MQQRLGYIGLGSNLGDRQGYIVRALALLADAAGLSVLRVSQLYESPAWGYASPHAFLNAVAEVSWAGTPEELLAVCRAAERACGRVRAETATPSQRPPAGLPGGDRSPAATLCAAAAPQYADRTLDLDILWLEGAEQLTPRLTLPHPQALQRAFVLVPWCELAPELELHGRSLSTWLALLPRSEVEAVTPFAD